MFSVSCVYPCILSCVPVYHSILLFFFRKVQLWRNFALMFHYSSVQFIKINVVLSAKAIQEHGFGATE